MSLHVRVFCPDVRVNYNMFLITTYILPIFYNIEIPVPISLLLSRRFTSRTSLIAVLTRILDLSQTTYPTSKSHGSSLFQASYCQLMLWPNVRG